MSSIRRGHACNFVEKPLEEIQTECPVCLHVLREPYQVTCCGYAFCRECIEMIESDDQPCPCCKDSFEAFEDKRLEMSLHAFNVHCSNKEQGCQWVGELGQLDNHLNLNPSQQNQLQGCQYSKIKCLHCSKLFLRSDIEDHQSNQCPRRPFSCEYCKEFDSCYEEVATDHWPVCEFFPILCTCHEVIKRNELTNHVANDCPLTIIDCDFQHVGCEVRLPRKDMPAHLRASIVDHLSQQAAHYTKVVTKVEEEKTETKTVISTLSKKSEKLEHNISALTKTFEDHIIRTPIGQQLFTLTNFKQKVNNECWTSPSFYSHQRGYKMCVNIIANNWYVFFGSYVTIYIRILKGEFDDQLTWPLRGRVHVALLSQDDDENKHHKKTMNITMYRQSNFIRHRRHSLFLDVHHGIVRHQELLTLTSGPFHITHHDNLHTSHKINDCLKFSVVVEET